MRISVASATLLLVLALPSARALATYTDNVLDAAALADLEARAEHAQTNEQAFLYTQLVHEYVEVAGKQVAAGDMDQATASLQRVQSYADRIHATLGNTLKRLDKLHDELLQQVFAH
jgi:hypothetical protein